MMQETQNIQHAEKEALPYEAPRMTTVPIRATGAMLVGSMMGQMEIQRNLENQAWWDFANNSDNVASEWNSATDPTYGEGWDNFF